MFLTRELPINRRTGFDSWCFHACFGNDSMPCLATWASWCCCVASRVSALMPVCGCWGGGAIACLVCMLLRRGFTMHILPLDSRWQYMMLHLIGVDVNTPAGVRASPDGWAVRGVVVSTRWWLLVDHCVLRNWDRILVRAVKGLISRAGMVSICQLLWQRDVKLQQTNPAGVSDCVEEIGSTRLYQFRLEGLTCLVFDLQNGHQDVVFLSLPLMYVDILIQFIPNPFSSSSCLCLKYVLAGPCWCLPWVRNIAFWYWKQCSTDRNTTCLPLTGYSSLDM